MKLKYVFLNAGVRACAKSGNIHVIHASQFEESSCTNGNEEAGCDFPHKIGHHRHQPPCVQSQQLSGEAISGLLKLQQHPFCPLPIALNSWHQPHFENNLLFDGLKHKLVSH